MMDQVQKYVFPSIFNPVSHTLLNSVLWPVLSKQFSSRPERQSSARPPRLQASQWHPRVAKRSSDRSSARHPCPQASQWHPRVAKGSSDRSSARRPLPEVPQRHPRVSKRASIEPLAREPSTEPLLGQGHVARLYGTGVKPVSCRCLGRTSARHPRREASQWHPRVAKRSSDRSSARRPCPQMSQWDPRGPTVSWCIG